MTIVKHEPRVALLTPELERAWRGASVIPEGTTPEELQAFAATCQRLGLDPLGKQIYLVRRWDQQLRREKATSQVSIEGFRVVAERTGQYRGQTDAEWCGPDGKWRDAWLQKEPPAAARIGVLREGFSAPLRKVARFASYAQTSREGKLTRTWATMPEVMIAKCAEALALRAAFPNELGGLYTPEEMAQADNPPLTVVSRPVEAPTRPAAALPAPEGVPPDEAPQEARSWETLRELYRGKLESCTTQDDLRAWVSALGKQPVPGEARTVLWGMFAGHCQKLGMDPNDFRQKKGGR